MFSGMHSVQVKKHCKPFGSSGTRCVTLGLLTDVAESAIDEGYAGVAEITWRQV